MNRSRYYTLRFSCPDRVGIVACVSGFLAEHSGWILGSSQHSQDGEWFFMRVEVSANSLAFGVDELRRQFAPIASELDMDWQISDSAVKTRVLILVSKQML